LEFGDSGQQVDRWQAPGQRTEGGMREGHDQTGRGSLPGHVREDDRESGTLKRNDIEEVPSNTEARFAVGRDLKAWDRRQDGGQQTLLNLPGDLEF
jgi:hypothetical protein